MEITDLVLPPDFTVWAGFGNFHTKISEAAARKKLRSDTPKQSRGANEPIPIVFEFHELGVFR